MSPDQQERFRELHASNIRNADIAEQLGLARPEAVADVAKRLGLGIRTHRIGNVGALSDEVKSEVCRRWIDDQTAGQIAGAMGFTRSKVIGIVYRAGLRRDHKPKKKRAPRPRTPAPSRKLAALPKPVVRAEPPPARLITAIEELPPVWQGIPFDQLRDNVEVAPRYCRFIATTDTGLDRPCCGAPTASGPWCATHLAIVYEPPAQRRRGPFMQPQWKKAGRS